MKKTFLFSLLFITLISCSRNHRPPQAEIIPDTTYIHDTILVDNYSWLKDKTRSEEKVLNYLEAENSYTKSVLASHKKIREDLFEEMKSRLQQDDTSVPVKKGKYYYYYRREKDKQYLIYCRKKGSLDAEEEIYLDINKLAYGKEFFSTYGPSVSQDHRYVAFSADTTGAETYDLHILNLQTGKYLPETRSGIGDYVWANDNKTLFYSTEDPAGRTWQVYRHKLGEKISEDELLFTEPDERFWVGLDRSRNNKFIVLYSGSKTTSEVYFLPADIPQTSFSLMQKRQQDVTYYPLFGDSDIYFVTNWQAPNKRIMKSSYYNYTMKYWQQVIPQRDSVKISAMISEDFLIVTEKHDGIEDLRIFDLAIEKSHYIHFDEAAYTFYTWSSTSYHSPMLRYSYESLQTPYTTYSYNMKTQQRKMLKQQIVEGDFSPEDYRTERLTAPARDGQEIPISLVYRQDLFDHDGTDPMLLTAYGAYGDSFYPYFSPSRLSLLDRGITYAIAHVRGGSEMGEEWYEQGKMLHKKNTFYDFIDCSKYLIDQNYTSADKLVIEGGSAGGLLIGAVLNMNPELYQAAIADVPFVDVLNTMLDPSLSAVVSEYEEWGNPNIKADFEYILSYSPYNNVKAQEYPHILAVAGFYDSRVNYWEAAKWTAKLRAIKTDSNYNLLYVNMNAGHGGASGRYDYLKEIALIYSFIFKTLDIY